jgi:DNA-binding beta-propeller fold protein YncE
MTHHWAAAITALAGAALPLTGSAAAAPDQPAPAVAERFAPGGDTGWDYLSYDAASNRLFISRADHVQVMDGATGKAVGEIPGTDGVHGVALVPQLNKGFTSNGKADSVTVFDLDSLKVRQQIALNGKKPDAIIYDPASRHVLAFDGHSNSLDTIDPATESLLAPLALPGRPEFAAADGQGRVYVNLEDKGKVTVIDSLAGKVLATWPLGTCEEPSGLALDPAHHRLFSVCQNRKMVVLDTASGKRVAQVPIGDGPDAAAFDPATGLIYSSNGDGTLTIAREESRRRFRVVANVATQKGARTLALDSAGRRIFLATADFTPPPPATPEQPHPHPGIVPGSFRILVVR